jgi:hypothetical protein
VTLRTAPILAALWLARLPAGAAAQEAFVGLYAHGVDTPLSLETGEGGADVVVGVRLAPIEALSVVGEPAPYVITSLNTVGDTSFAGAGLSWTFGKGPVYVRPAVALVVHDGPSSRFDPVLNQQTELGSRVLFEPELAIGYHLGGRLAVEASWMHVSHARLFDRQQNPGIDMWGARLNYRL